MNFQLTPEQEKLQQAAIHFARRELNNRIELEREMRDWLRSRLFSGTSEIQRNIIARGLRI